MSVDYRLEALLPIPAREALAEVGKRLGGSTRLPDGGPGAQGHGVTAWLVDADGADREVIRGAFGFTPTITIGFGPTGGEGWAAAVAAMTDAVFGLVLREGVIAVLLAGGEEVVLAVRDGRVLLSADREEWDLPQVRIVVTATVRVPYDRRALPSPLL
jgi:hypothetical protein